MMNSASEALLAYLAKKDQYSAFVDAQRYLQIEIFRMCEKINEQRLSDDIAKDYLVDIKGRAEHQMLLELIAKLEREIELQVEVLSKEYGIIAHSNLTLKEIQNSIDEDDLNKYPQLTSLIHEFFASIDELVGHAEEIENAKWITLKRAKVDDINISNILSSDKEFYREANKSEPMDSAAQSEVYNDIYYEDGEQEQADLLELVREITKDLKAEDPDQIQLGLYNKIRELGKSKRQGFLKNLHKISSQRKGGSANK